MSNVIVPANAQALPASRRSVLRGLVALPAATLPVMASAAASVEPDPVFAAIEEHRAALAATAAAPTSDEVDALAEIDDDLLHELAETVPLTVSGLRAMVLHFAELQRMSKSDWDVGLAFPSIAQAMTALFPAA